VGSVEMEYMIIPCPLSTAAVLVYVIPRQYDEHVHRSCRGATSMPKNGLIKAARKSAPVVESSEKAAGRMPGPAMRLRIRSGQSMLRMAMAAWIPLRMQNPAGAAGLGPYRG